MGCVCSQIVCNDDGLTLSKLGTSHSSSHLFTEHLCRPSFCHTTIKPAIAPIQQPKAIDLAIVSRRLDEALPTSPLWRPKPRQGRMKGKLDLVLQIEVCMRHESKQIRKIRRELWREIWLN